MPLFTNVNLGVPKPLDLENYQATFGESLSASFEMGLEANPMSILTRSQKMSGLDGFDLGDSQLPLDAREIIDVEDFAADYAQKALSLEDQARQIKEAGLEGQLKPVEGYRQEALDIVIENKRMENVISAMNPGLGASLLGGLAAGFLDPINLASAFVPVVGEARMMSLMSAAKGIGQRALIRGGIGAASGMVGSALLEPIIYLGQQEVQADYTLANSLRNLFVGAIMGAGLHSAFGTFAEWRRAKSGKPQPWEYVPPDFTTEEWKNAHAADLYRYQMEATPEADPVDVRQWAEDTAATFDARARNWAWHEKKTVKEFYDQWRPEYRTWQDDAIWREAMPAELRGNLADYDGGDLGWIGRQYEGLRTLNADAMALPEFLDNLNLWEERFPDLHDYTGIRQTIEDARAGHIINTDALSQPVEGSPRDATPRNEPSTGPIAHENVNTVEDLYSAARESQPVFNDLINSVAEATGGEAHFRPGEGLKSVERVMRKIEQDYPEEGARRVVDVLGATLLYKDRAAVENAVNLVRELAEKNGGKVARVKDRFKNPSMGYKDFLLNIKMPNGFVTELLMTTKAMSEAKNGKTGVGHQIYEAMQEVSAVMKRTDLSESQLEDANLIFQKLERASENYYGSTGNQSNLTASLSGIVEPLNWISGRTGDLEIFSSVYPNVVSLLGTMRQRLPSVAVKNGLSSYSRNLSTNTVPPSGNVNIREGAGSDFIPTRDMASRNEGEFSGVLDDGITQSPVDKNITTGENSGKDGTGKTLFQSSPATIGKKTQILGANSKEIARYELRELEDVIPSHDPENSFRKRPDYPEIAQERPYHSDEGEQQKVIGNALGYEPGFVISTDASATNGPPIITKDGIVLGGNSRAMTLQLVYGGHFPEKAAAYRQVLVDNAAQFGIDPQAVASMKKPMLVRVISGDLTPEQMAKRSREYNQTTTQQLQGEAEGISRARFVDRPTLNALVAGLKDGKTISEFLASPESADFAIVLQDAGVLQQTEISSLIYPDSGKLNDAGKARVMQIMRGLVLPDYDIMTSLPKGVLNNLDASIPVLALSRMRGEGWDLTGAFYEAMRLTADAKNKGVPIEQQFFQHTLTGSVDPMRENPAVQALALLFSKTDPKEIRMRMEHYLSLADSEGAGQNSLMPGIRITPEQAFRKAFLETLAFIGNERIPNFNSANNVRHAAIRWAVENGGKSPTIERALNKIEREIAKKKTTPEEKARLSEYKKELAPLSGFVGIREPKFGEFWKDPGKIEIPAGKKPGEKGALPEASHIDEPVVMDDPDTLLPPELQENPRITARGSVRFNAEDRPIVTFFQSANFSTAPHELFHIFRREMERTALSADGSLHSKEQWKRLCDYVGAKPDGVWTVEMEEKFANAGLRYLAEGRAPSPSLQGIFERLKAWFMELFQRAEEIGAEISPEMRKAFDEMFSVPYETADANFRRSMGDLHSREVEQEFADPDTIDKPLSPDDQRLAENTGDLSMVEELTQEAQIRADEAAARLEQNNPELRQAIDETNTELAEIDKEIGKIGERDELRRQAVECLVNGG